MQSPTFTFRQCVRYLRSSEMTSLFACMSDLTLFMRMDPQGMYAYIYIGFGNVLGIMFFRFVFYLLFCPFSLQFATFWSWKLPFQWYLQHFGVRTSDFP